jgi:hypothetical protein
MSSPKAKTKPPVKNHQEFFKKLSELFTEFDFQLITTHHNHQTYLMHAEKDGSTSFFLHPNINSLGEVSSDKEPLYKQTQSRPKKKNVK